MKIRTRGEVPKKDKWDLSTVYISDEAWYQDFEIVSSEIKNIENFKGKIVNNAKNLLSYLKWSDDKERKLEKLYTYSRRKFDEDLNNPKYQTMQGKMDNLVTEDNKISAFVRPEMLSVEYDTIRDFYKQNKELCEYQHVLEDFYRYKKHSLSEPEEKILSSLSKSLSSANEIYEALNYADLNYGTIQDENGNEVELTSTNYSHFVRSKDREIRKNAFVKLHETWAKVKNTVSGIYNQRIDCLTSMAKIRNHENSLEGSLFQDNVDSNIYNTLIDTIHKNLDVSYKYFALKKELLGVEELHLYDIYKELIPELDKKYEYEEGKRLVTEALSILGKQYSEDLQKAFDEGWIDIYPNKGKRTGAYSSGSYDTKPFILLNYEEKMQDVSTLAHELGHSMHTYYSNKSNSYHNSNYKIFVAEVASTVNEFLLNQYLLKNSKDKKEKLSILNEMMELFKSTIYRQVMFAEFERDMHAKYESGDILTYEVLCDEYYKLNQKYFGKDVIVDDEIRYEWERIPHFYYNFYVYKYAIGLSAACYIATNILEGKEGALESYLNFLTLGGSMYPTEELKVAGVDVNSPEVIESAIKMFDSIIDEFKTLYNE